MNELDTLNDKERKSAMNAIKDNDKLNCYTKKIVFRSNNLREDFLAYACVEALVKYIGWR